MEWPDLNFNTSNSSRLSASDYEITLADMRVSSTIVRQIEFQKHEKCGGRQILGSRKESASTEPSRARGVENDSPGKLTFKRTARRTTAYGCRRRPIQSSASAVKFLGARSVSISRKACSRESFEHLTGVANTTILLVLTITLNNA
jgi:hypothetical protein